MARARSGGPVESRRRSWGLVLKSLRLGGVRKKVFVGRGGEQLGGAPRQFRDGLAGRQLGPAAEVSGCGERRAAGEFGGGEPGYDVGRAGLHGVPGITARISDDGESGVCDGEGRQTEVRIERQFRPCCPPSAESRRGQADAEQEPGPAQKTAASRSRTPRPAEASTWLRADGSAPDASPSTVTRKAGSADGPSQSATSIRVELVSSARSTGCRARSWRRLGTSGKHCSKRGASHPGKRENRALTGFYGGE